MSWRLIGSATGSTDVNHAVSGAINTTGAKLIQIVTANEGAAPVITDSKVGNVFAQIVTAINTVRITTYWCAPVSVGASHTFTATQAGTFPSISVVVYFADGTVTLDRFNVASTPSAVTLQTGLALPAYFGELLLAGFAGGNAGLNSINDSFSIVANQPFVGGTSDASAIAALQQASASGHNPAWSINSAQFMSVAIATFRESTATAAPGEGADAATQFGATVSGYPTLTYASNLDAETQSEFQLLTSQLEGYLGVDHMPDGTHSNIRAITITTTDGIKSGTAVTVGRMPTTFSLGTVVSIVDTNTAVNSEAGFFGVNSQRVQTDLRSLESYLYLGSTGYLHPVGIKSTVELSGLSTRPSTGQVGAAFEAVIICDATSVLIAPNIINGFNVKPTGTPAAGVFLVTAAYHVEAFGNGFTTKYSFLSDDPTAPIVNPGQIQTSTGFLMGAWPTTASGANAFVADNDFIYRSTSSKRYKKDILALSLENARHAIMHLQPITYCANDTVTRRDGTRFPGFIAESVADVDPLLVTFDKDKRPDNVTYDRVVVYLCPVVQDHETRLQALEKRVT